MGVTWVYMKKLILILVVIGLVSAYFGKGPNIEPVQKVVDQLPSLADIKRKASQVLPKQGG